jgi:LacI family transcriptional regulator
MERKATLFDIADALGVSTGTVHRALHNHPGVNPDTKTRVLKMAKSMQYRPNLAARYLSRRRRLQISVNTLQGTTSYWDEVRAGIEEEARSVGMESIEVQYRTYPHLGEGEEEAFEEAIRAQVKGIITFPSHPKLLRPWIRRASRAQIPVVCVSTDAPEAGRLAVVSIDTMVSGSLAADLMGRLTHGRGKVAVTLGDAAITEHGEKCKAFESTLKSFYPAMEMQGLIEDHNLPSEAYDKGKELFAAHPDLAGIYIVTELSMPVLKAAREAGILERLVIITTDLFPALVEQIRSGAVLATIYQRPHTQGRMAFRVLHEYLVEGQAPSRHVTLAPHLVMRGNLDFFLQRKSFEADAEQDSRHQMDSPDLEGYSVG